LFLVELGGQTMLQKERNQRENRLEKGESRSGKVKEKRGSTAERESGRRAGQTKKARIEGGTHT